jgi:hypothetical protein
MSLIGCFRPLDLIGLLTSDPGKKLAVERLEQVLRVIGIALHHQRAYCDFFSGCASSVQQMRHLKVLNLLLRGGVFGVVTYRATDVDIAPFRQQQFRSV